MKSAKQKILAYLSKTDGYNTLTVRQARARFGITNVSARIDELRKDGYAIYTNTKTSFMDLYTKVDADAVQPATKPAEVNPSEEIPF